jgi:hypothetical protein
MRDREKHKGLEEGKVIESDGTHLFFSTLSDSAAQAPARALAKLGERGTDMARGRQSLVGKENGLGKG